MKNEAELLSATLDRGLAARGHDAMARLAEQLAEKSDLTETQIYNHLKDWRRSIRAGLGFDLALKVVLALPELQHELAHRSGFVLIPVPKAVTSGPLSPRGEALRELMRDMGETIAAASEAEITEEGLALVEREIEEDYASALYVLECCRRELRDKQLGGA